MSSGIHRCLLEYTDDSSICQAVRDVNLSTVVSHMPDPAIGAIAAGSTPRARHCGTLPAPQVSAIKPPCNTTALSFPPVYLIVAGY